MRRLLVLALLASSLTGCAVTHQTSTLVGTPRAAISPDQVKLYTRPPAKYVEIAIVATDAAHDFMDKQALQDAAVMNAKKEAAKLGANGILLDGLGDFQTGSSGVTVMQQPYRRGAPGIGVVSSSVRTGKQVGGMAIFVTEE